MRRISLLALAAALLLALPALAALPPQGARYTGRTSQNRALTARVTSDAKGVQLVLDQVFTCNRGAVKTTHTTFLEQRPDIRADGTFEYFKTYRDLAPVPGFGERHTERQRVTGSFAADGKSVRGRISVSDVGRSGLRCKSTVTFTARRRS